MTEARLAQRLNVVAGKEGVHKVKGSAQEHLRRDGSPAEVVSVSMNDVQTGGLYVNKEVTAVFTVDGRAVTGTAVSHDPGDATFAACKDALLTDFPELAAVQAKLKLNQNGTQVQVVRVSMTAGGYEWTSMFHGNFDVQRNTNVSPMAQAYAEGLLFAAQRVKVARSLQEK